MTGLLVAVALQAAARVGARAGAGVGAARAGARLVLRRWAGPDPVLVAECAELAAAVDALAVERDDLFARVRDLDRQVDRLHLRLRRRGQALALARAAVSAALEPARVPGCVKIRHMLRETAEQQAMHLARAAAGEWLHVYLCSTCPAYPWPGTRPWHVGHCAERARDGVVFTGGVLRHGCGCAFRWLADDAVEDVAVCAAHGEAAA